MRQSKCGCFQSTEPSRWPWFAKPGSYHTRWSPIWLGGDEYCRRTLVLGWGFLGLLIIPLRECRGCEDCGHWVIDGRFYPKVHRAYLERQGNDPTQVGSPQNV